MTAHVSASDLSKLEQEYGCQIYMNSRGYWVITDIPEQEKAEVRCWITALTDKKDLYPQHHLLNRSPRSEFRANARAFR